MSDTPQKTRREAVESMAHTIITDNRSQGGSMSYEQAKNIAARAERVNRETINRSNK